MKKAALCWLEIAINILDMQDHHNSFYIKLLQQKKENKFWKIQHIYAMRTEP